MRKVTPAGKQKIVLTELEKKGSAEDLAASHINLATDREVRQIGQMRASSLYSSCVRKHVVGTQYAMEEVQWTNLTSRITFGIGSAVHSWIQNSPAVFGDKRHGWWRCSSCDELLYFGRPTKGICHKCNARNEAIVYEEHFVDTLNPFPCSGHPDMFLDVNGKMRVVEIKTIAAEAFKELYAPLVDHAWQVSYYMWACSQDEQLPIDLDPTVGYVLYVSKGQLYKSLPFKMFVVTRSPTMIKSIKTKLKLYSDHMKANTFPPPLPECINVDFSKGTAQWCSIRDRCKSLWAEGM